MTQEPKAIADYSDGDLYTEWNNLSDRFGKGELNPAEVERKRAAEAALISRGVLRSRL